MNEQWKDIEGYDYRYQVSNLGRVRTFSRWREGRIMKTYLPPDGRLMLKLIKNGKYVAHLVHVLVAEHFIGPRPEGQVVCHGPKGALVNSVDNLRYATHSENCFDKYRDGTMYNARKVKRSDGVVFDSIAIAARASGINQQNIVSTLKGRRNRAGGYTWEYADA